VPAIEIELTLGDLLKIGEKKTPLELADALSREDIELQKVKENE